MVPKVLRKVCFFMRFAVGGVILTTKILSKRKVVRISWCLLCKKACEDVDQIILYCKLALRL